MQCNQQATTAQILDSASGTLVRWWEGWGCPKVSDLLGVLGLWTDLGSYLVSMTLSDLVQPMILVMRSLCHNQLTVANKTVQNPSEFEKMVQWIIEVWFKTVQTNQALKFRCFTFCLFRIDMEHDPHKYMIFDDLPITNSEFSQLCSITKEYCDSKGTMTKLVDSHQKCSNQTNPFPKKCSGWIIPAVFDHL